MLVASGMLEAVWAAALSASHGFTRLRPTLLFLVALTSSMAGLARAMTDIPTGTAYAVWVGIGAVLTVVCGPWRREMTSPPAVASAMIPAPRPSPRSRPSCSSPPRLEG